MGLIADATLLCNFMHQECLDSRPVFDRPLPVSRLASLIGSKTQTPTQTWPEAIWSWPAGYADQGPPVFQTRPSANVFEGGAMPTGAPSQPACTYSDRHTECDLNELVKRGPRALREAIPAEQDLTTKGVSTRIAGKDLEFMIYDDDDDVSPFLEGLRKRLQRQSLLNIQKRLINQRSSK